MARRKRTKADDFTIIPGGPRFVSTSLHNYGVLTFDDLQTANLSWLPPRVRAAIERWRDG